MESSSQAVITGKIFRVVKNNWMFTASLGNWKYLLTARKTWHWTSVKALHNFNSVRLAVPWMAEYLLKNKAPVCTMLENLLKGLCFFQQTLNCNHHQGLFIIKAFIQTGSSSPPSWTIQFVFSSWRKTWNTSKQQSIKSSCAVKCVSTTRSKRLPDPSIIWLVFSLSSEEKILPARAVQMCTHCLLMVWKRQGAWWEKLPTRVCTKDGPKLDDRKWINRLSWGGTAVGLLRHSGCISSDGSTRQQPFPPLRRVLS